MDFVGLRAQAARCSRGLSARLARVLDHGQYILGPEVGELEAALSDYLEGGFALGCSSGSSALQLALMAYEIGPGDLVFVPAFTFVATAEAVSLLGATVIFVDVDPRSYNLDPSSLEEALERHSEGAGERGSQALRRPAAIVSVDLFGQPADYETIGRLAQRRGLPLIADGAQSFGAIQGKKKSGGLCPCSTTSFFPSKPLGCYGDGGAVFCESEVLHARLRSLRGHGCSATGQEIERVGMNARLDTVQAAVLLEKLTVFDEELSARRRLARLYDQLLSGIVQTPQVISGTESAWAQYTIVLPGFEKISSAQRRQKRAEVKKSLEREGIPTRIYYERPLHREPVYASSVEAGVSLKESEFLSESVLSLPMHPYLRDEDLVKVAAALKKAL